MDGVFAGFMPAPFTLIKTYAFSCVKTLTCGNDHGRFIGYGVYQFMPPSFFFFEYSDRLAQKMVIMHSMIVMADHMGRPFKAQTSKLTAAISIDTDDRTSAMPAVLSVLFFMGLSSV